MKRLKLRYNKSLAQRTPSCRVKMDQGKVRTNIFRASCLQQPIYPYFILFGPVSSDYYLKFIAEHLDIQVFIDVPKSIDLEQSQVPDSDQCDFKVHAHSLASVPGTFGSPRSAQGSFVYSQQPGKRQSVSLRARGRGKVR
jgi:hypothetical protein